MPHGFEKPHKNEEEKASEKPELGNMSVELIKGNKITLQAREDLTHVEMLDKSVYEDAAIIQSLNDFEKTLDKEITPEVNYGALRDASNKEEYENTIEDALKKKSFERSLQFLDAEKKKFLATQETFEKIYNQVLDQRLVFKGIDDLDLDKKIKERLEKRISEVQQTQKHIADVLEFIESKRAEVVINGLKEGQIEEHQDFE